jgi:hypothetical protein
MHRENEAAPAENYENYLQNELRSLGIECKRRMNLMTSTN